MRSGPAQQTTTTIPSTGAANESLNGRETGGGALSSVDPAARVSCVTPSPDRSECRSPAVPRPGTSRPALDREFHRGRPVPADKRPPCLGAPSRRTRSVANRRGAYSHVAARVRPLSPARSRCVHRPAAAPGCAAGSDRPAPEKTERPQKRLSELESWNTYLESRIA